MKKILIFAEGKTSLELFAAAKDIADAEVKVVTFNGMGDFFANYGAEVKVMPFENYDSDLFTAAVAALMDAEKPDYVWASATQSGKDLTVRLAAKFDAPCVTTVVAVKEEEGKTLYTAPAYGGGILETYSYDAALQLASFRSGAYKAPEAGAACAVSEYVPAEAQLQVKIREAVKEISEAVALEDADVIVTGGRGMGSAESFKLVEQLAERLGGAVGATRPAMEQGWISRAHQVGQSGKIVAPKLYIACGVSGATQHVSAIMDSGLIVAINTDEEAPIFDIADIGIVGDVNVIIPQILEQLK